MQFESIEVEVSDRFVRGVNGTKVDPLAWQKFLSEGGKGGWRVCGIRQTDNVNHYFVIFQREVRAQVTYTDVYVSYMDSAHPRGLVMKIDGKETKHEDWIEFWGRSQKAGHRLCGMVTNVVHGNTLGFTATFELETV